MKRWFLPFGLPSSSSRCLSASFSTHCPLPSSTTTPFRFSTQFSQTSSWEQVSYRRGSYGCKREEKGGGGTSGQGHSSEAETHDQESAARSRERKQVSLHGFLRVLEFRDTLLAALHDDGFADVDSESSNPLVIKNFEDSILLLFPAEARVAIENAVVDSASLDTTSSALKRAGANREVDLNETPAVQTEKLQLRLQSLQKNRRFFPHCSEVLENFLEDHIPDVFFLEKGSEEEQRIKKARFMELKDDVQKAFHMDMAENKRHSGLSSSMSSSSSSSRKEGVGHRGQGSHKEEKLNRASHSHGRNFAKGEDDAQIDDVRIEGDLGSSATIEKAGVGDGDDDAATHHRCGACPVSLPDSCAPPSVLMNSFERRVMADLEDIKRANNSIREEQILLKSMIERINSIYVKPELKENERLMKNSKTNPITTPHKTCKITKNIKKSDSKSIFNMDVHPNICLDLSDNEDDVMELDRTTITRQDPRKVAVQQSIPSIKRQKLSPQPNGKGKAKPLSKPWFPGPSERRTRFQNTVEAFRGVQRPRRMSTSEMDAQVSRGEAVRASSTPVAARGITIYFKMGGEINLSKGQVEMFAYVFDPDLSPSEHIVKIGGSSAIRQELFCLSKDHIITAKIYIPIKDNDHWYLMVMSLEPKIVFHLDSNLPPECKEPRTESTNTLVLF
ncbi:hypothetical protein Ahy_B05g075602 isoform B [Arachis hypogaea]|uniref:NPR1/NIM1-like C-terminal domain-containing protein n=1 Tax=Arachis hypogaea TaxID=3818 RepID=A0A444Z1L2_ARAHY|nr:hypothetical protein Ahy_B05g075602 isoform B [Arachis hypogaea]